MQRSWLRDPERHLGHRTTRGTAKGQRGTEKLLGAHVEGTAGQREAAHSGIWNQIHKQMIPAFRRSLGSEQKLQGGALCVVRVCLRSWSAPLLSPRPPSCWVHLWLPLCYKLTDTPTVRTRSLHLGLVRDQTKTKTGLGAQEKKRKEERKISLYFSKC